MIALHVKVMNHYSAKLPRRRPERRIRGLQQPGPAQPSAKLWVILNHDTGEWRVDDAGAWLEDSEDMWVVEIGPDTRGHDVEKRCQEILQEAINNL